MNFLLHEHIEELPEYSNRQSWRFDVQQDDGPNCVLHYTRRAPWLGGSRTPSQVLFEKFCGRGGLARQPAVIRVEKIGSAKFLAECARAIAGTCFSNWSFLYGIAGAVDCLQQKSHIYWLIYIRNTPTRRQLLSAPDSGDHQNEI